MMLFFLCVLVFNEQRIKVEIIPDRDTLAVPSGTTVAADKEAEVYDDIAGWDTTHIRGTGYHLLTYFHSGSDVLQQTKNERLNFLIGTIEAKKLKFAVIDVSGVLSPSFSNSS
jgi:hypothetical protein